jgi:hypothetical protein
MRSSVLAFAASFVLLAAATTAVARNPWEGQPPYGVPMMSDEEKRTYWKEIQALPSVEEKEVYWLAHIERMEQRALERGLSLPPPPRRRIPDSEKVALPAAPYFYEIMTDEEREAYYEGLGKLTVLVERRAFIADHIERMQARGRTRGVSLPSAADWAYVFEGRAQKKTIELEDAAGGTGGGEAETDEESEVFEDEDE